MQEILLVIHLIVSLAIIVVVLLQPSEAGGFMGSSGGSMSNMMTPRRSADVMTRLTTILVACFFATSLLLAVMAGHRPKAEGVLDIANKSTPVTLNQPAVAEEGDAAVVPMDEAEAADKKPAPKSNEPETPKAPLAK
jgi:preprotein translocase subunit SecG